MINFSKQLKLIVPILIYISISVFISQAQGTAAVTGIVFDDSNNNGQQDEGEIGLSNVVIVAIEEDTGAPITATTDSDGMYRIEADRINHRIRVDESSLPFTGELTTSRLEYNLNVPPGFVAPLINFGYQEVEPSNVYGTIFDDANGNGQQDADEAGLGGVDIIATHDETGAIITLTTDASGDYNLQATPINHQLRVDEATLPFTGQLTTGRESYNLNVPSGYFAPNISFGYQEVEPATIFGTVFDDANGNGTQDDGEIGLSGVTIIVTHDETGVVTTIVTDSEGSYSFEAVQINHQLRVDEATLPFTGQLTTGRESYNLNVPPAFFAPNISFGYQEIEPSVVSGIVFHDINDSGEQDDNEPGIPDITLDIVERDGDTTTIMTAADGSYRYETTTARFDLSVDTETLPFANPILTTTRATYSLNIPNGFIAPAVHFGYRAATSDDFPPIVAGSSQTESTTPDVADNPPDNLTNPFDNPDPDLPLPDTLPADAGTYALPLEGNWVNYNGSLTFNCNGMSFDQPPAPPEDVVLTVAADGSSITGQGFDGGTNTLTASDTVRGFYTGTITISQDGASGTLDFYAQVVTPRLIVGYLTGEISAEGVACSAYRPFEMEYAGG